MGEGRGYMFIIDTKTIVTPQNGLNIYRGRTENNIISMEPEITDIGVKPEADELLSGTLKKRKSKGMILVGNMGDPYNDLEKEYGIMRKCLKWINYFDFGVVITTRRSLLLRDIDMIKDIDKKTKAVVEIPIPSIEVDKMRAIDGGSLSERLLLMEELHKAEIPFIINIYPIVPFVNDDPVVVKSMLGVLKDFRPTAIDLGGASVPLVKKQMDYFYLQYQKRFPEEYNKYLDAHGRSKNIIIDTEIELIDAVRKTATTIGAMWSPPEILDWKRRYENKQAGEQMTFDF